MYVKRKLKNTYTNFTVGEFLLVQKLGKHPLSTESGATMGGTDISLGRISGALAGASHWNKNIQIEKAAKRDGLGNAATALRAQYGFGDGMQRLQLESILKGDTVLARGTGTGEAETVAKDGKRTVYLNNYKDTMSREEKLAMGITLGHEAYRDGLVGTEQQQFMETTRAVIGHTELALRMQSDARYTKSLDNIIAGSSILQKDIAAYKSGDMMTMIGHVAGNYDYSKDYWRLTQDGELVNDGQGWLRDVDGKYINIDGTRTGKPIEGKTLGAKGIETGLLNILYGGTSGRRYDDFSVEQQINSHLIMEDAKIASYYENENLRGIRRTLWDKTAKNPLDMDYVMTLAGKTIAAPVFARYYDSTVDVDIAKNKSVILEDAVAKHIPNVAKRRYNDLYNAKFEFYKGAGSVVDLSLDYYISGDYNTEHEDPTTETRYYKFYNYRHYGIDLSRIGGSKGDLIYSGLSGSVSLKNWNIANGNCIRIEYGYNFEKAFIGTGIYGEYLHMENPSTLEKDTYVNSSTILGTIGGSGNGRADCYVPHLHYDILSFTNSYVSQTTLQMLLGNRNTWGDTVTSENKDRITYNPNLYYNNFLKHKLNLK